MASKRMLELKRIEPPFVPKVNIRVGESFYVAARVLADNISTSVAESFVTLHAYGNGLPQRSEFAVEVIL